MGLSTAVVTHRPEWADQLLDGRLEGGDLEALLAVCRLVRKPARALLLRGEDDRVLLLLRGSAKAHLTTSEGDEVITAIHGPGYAAGLLVALGHASTSTDLTSMEPADGLMVSGSDLRALLADRPRIVAACLRTVAAQHAEAYAERARFAGTCIAQRVAARLLELANGWGRTEGAHVRITLSITQEELASWSGASRESVAKVLQGMRASGVLLTGRRSLTILDLERLRSRHQRPAPDGLRRLLESHG